MRGRLLIIVVVLGAMVVGLLIRMDDEEPGEADVVVVGDSVTDQSHDQIVAALAGQDVEVLGHPGYTTVDLLPVVEEALGGGARPPVAVVMAGYNDLWKGVDGEAVVEDVVEVMAEVDCAVWVLTPTKGPWALDRAEAFDARVREAAGAAGVAVDTGWQDAIDAGDGPDPVVELVVGDGVHPSDAGRAKVAEVMAAAVERHCG